MGGGRGKKGGKKSSKGKAAPAPKKKKPKLTGPGMGPRGKLGPKGTVSKAQQAAKNRIAKKTTATKAASMGATSKSFTSGLPSYSSLTSPTEAKKMFSPKANKGPSFKQSVKMATTPTPAPKVESSKDVASVTGYGLRPDGVTGEYKEGDVFNTGGKSGKDYKYEGVPGKGAFVPLKTAFIPNWMKKPIIPNADEKGKNYLNNVRDENAADETKGLNQFFKNLQMRDKMLDQSSNFKTLGTGMLTAFNPAAGMMIGGGLGQPANAATVDSNYSPSIGGLGKMLGFNPTTGTFNAPPGSTGLVGVTGGGLNIGGAGFNQSDGGGAASRAISDRPASSFNFGPTIDRFGRGDEYARNLNEFGMRFGETPEARADAYDRSLTGRKGLFDDATVGSGPVASGDAYARGLQTSRFGSPMNAIKTGLNFMGANLRLQNDKELADSVGRAPTLTRARRRGGARLAAVQPQQPLTPEEILEPQQVAPAQSGPAYQQAGMDNSRLMQIQNDAYGRQMSQLYNPPPVYNPMEVGGFSPLFRFFGRRGGPRRGAFRKAFRRN